MKQLHYDGPIILAVLDGVGLRVARSGNAVRQAHTEFLDQAMTKYLNIPLAASGEAVGIMAGQMGNSEVGHNALGSGQIIQQGIAQVETAFATGDIWDSKAWKGAMRWLGKGINSPERRSGGTLHFCGIFSDGQVHSDIRHLEMMIQRAYDEGVRRMRIHCVFDGRDVAPQSEPKYIMRLEKFCQKFPDADIRIASGVGRMVGTADRYENDWGMVKTGWDLMVRGKAEREYTSATEAIKAIRHDDPQVQDQYLPPFVIIEKAGAASALAGRAERVRSSDCRKTQPIGKIVDGDAVIYYDFRADRAVEIATAFTAEEFDKFDRRDLPKIFFAGLTEYDADRHIPANILVPPIKIHSPLNTFLGKNKIRQLAVSETVKFGHITYYFNGNSYRNAPYETQIEIPSDTQPFNTRPWMKSAEITDTVLENLERNHFIRVNYPGGDMVGHFADLEATIVAVEAIDLQLRRLAQAVDQLGGMLLITADHGNAEEVIDSQGNAKTSHTTNPVPCIFYDNTVNARHYVASAVAKPGLANIAATIATLLGLEDYPIGWQPPLIRPR